MVFILGFSLNIWHWQGTPAFPVLPVTPNQRGFTGAGQGGVHQVTPSRKEAKAESFQKCIAFLAACAHPTPSVPSVGSQVLKQL